MAPAASALAQGVSTRSVHPTPRGKPSDLPFNSKLIDIGRQAGLNAPVIYGEPETKDYIIETVGCGIAAIDFDQDGWLDLFVLCGTKLAGDPELATNRLYKNNRDGTFTDVTARAGLQRTGWAVGVCVGDYNNDGLDDLFVTYWGQNVLYRNNGDGTFTDVTKEAGLLHPKRRWSSGCTFVDIDRNGQLDLMVTTYVDFDPKKVPKPGQNANCNWKGVPTNCGPRGLPPGRVYLYRNNGDGTFTDISDKSGVSKASGSYCFTAVAADFRNSGWPDIFVACDSTPSFMFRNNKNGTFTEIGLESGIALNEDGMEQAGMGVGVGDYNLDGNLDVFKTHFSDDSDILYKNDGKGNFEDMTIRAGIGVETRYIGWGTGIVDLDNDGQPDLFLVTGSVYPEVEKTLPDYPFKTPRIVFRNLGAGKFEELIEKAGPGVATPHASRGCAFGDFDNDGDMDVAIVNLNEPPSLLRNDVTSGGHWLKLKLVGTTSNRTAIGARATITYDGKLQAQEVQSQASFMSVNDLRLHFGLGAAKKVDIDIRWPTGQHEKFPKLDVNQLVTIKEGAGIVKKEPFPKT